MSESIGKKIKQLRKDNKDTLKSLAEKIDYDWSNLSKVERGVYVASVDLIKRIADIYDVNPNYFFVGLTDPESQLFKDENIELESLKNKYEFVKNSINATDEEIMEAILLIRQIRQIPDKK